MSRSLGWVGSRAVYPLVVPPRIPGNVSKGSQFQSQFRLALSLQKCSARHHQANTKRSLSSKPMTMDFRVATYNILCSHLAEPSRFPLCEVKNLDAPTRLERVKQKLDDEISRGAVICLQEVGIQWAGDLHVFFMARGYAFVTANYGAHFNNYMGVALAWPLDKYEALTVDMTRVSETRKWGREPRGANEGRETSATPGAEWRGPLGALMKLAGRGEKHSMGINGGAARFLEREPEDPWKLAERRFNQVLFARLRPKENASAPNGGTFCVGTYHMPCLFNVRPVMVMHTSMVIKHLARLAGSDPLVFAGDFNFNPDSECYKLATQGDLPSSSPDFPERPEWEKEWSAKTGVELLSAYKEVEGVEPNFTNNAKVEDYEPFIDTLDYIFHTRSITATKVLPLKHRDDVQGPFPIAEEPSDHVLLAAEYTIDPPVADA